MNTPVRVLRPNRGSGSGGLAAGFRILQGNPGQVLQIGPDRPLGPGDTAQTTGKLLHRIRSVVGIGM